jgi:histidyl-tRNA synthetase
MSKTSAAPPKGTRDFLPTFVRQREHVVGVIRSVYESYGFQPLETPALERLDVLSGKYGEEGDQLLFKVLLRGQPLVQGIEQAHAHLQEPGAIINGRSGQVAPKADVLLSDLGLRYDLTVPLARVYAAHQAELGPIFKRYQIQPVWRADTPGKGRFREFYQCDLDVCGSDSLLVEAEVASAACECLVRLGFAEFTLRVNHRGLLRALMNQAGIDASKEVDAITALDKFDKVGAEGVDAELAERQIPEAARSVLLGLLRAGATLESVGAFLKGHAAGEKALADVLGLFELLEGSKAASHLAFDFSLARGLSYYTGCIFELSSKDLAGSLGGGGRYDGLIGMFLGRDVPACGFALGLERLLLVMQERNLFPAELGSLEILLAGAPGESGRRVLRLSQMLREHGYHVSMVPKPEKPGRLRKTAAEAPADYAIWLEGGALNLWERKTDATLRNLDEAALLAALEGHQKGITRTGPPES